MSDRKKIIDHIARLDGPVEERTITHIVPPSSQVAVSVHIILPRSGRDYMTLFTTGLSEKALSVPADGQEYRHAELLINLPPEWKIKGEEFRNEIYHWPIEWLFKIAYYPHARRTWLGGATMVFADEDRPGPLASNTALSCMLLVADKTVWGRVDCGEEKQVFFYTLMPLYSEEREVEMRHGVVELLKRFHLHDIGDVVDLKRANAAAASGESKKPWWKW